MRERREEGVRTRGGREDFWSCGCTRRPLVLVLRRFAHKSCTAQQSGCRTERASERKRERAVVHDRETVTDAGQREGQRCTTESEGDGCRTERVTAAMCSRTRMEAVHVREAIKQVPSAPRSLYTTPVGFPVQN